MPWAKGQSGNPGGRPKTKVVTEALARELRAKGPDGAQSNLQLAAWKMVQLAIAGDVAAFKEIANRLEGTPVQAVEHTGADGATMEFTIQIARPPSEADDADDA
jgi:hypothetical protein